MKATKDFLKIC